MTCQGIEIHNDFEGLINSSCVYMNEFKMVLTLFKKTAKTT